jgi:hypothetical protein
MPQRINMGERHGHTFSEKMEPSLFGSLDLRSAALSRHPHARLVFAG